MHVTLLQEARWLCPLWSRCGAAASKHALKAKLRKRHCITRRTAAFCALALPDIKQLSLSMQHKLSDVCAPASYTTLLLYVCWHRLTRSRCLRACGDAKLHEHHCIARHAAAFEHAA